MDNRCVKIYDLKQKIKYHPEIGSYILEEDIDLMGHIFVNEFNATKYRDDKSSIEVIEQPKTIATCNECGAILRFSCEDVSERTSYSRCGGHYFAINCPCCKRVVRVWE